MTLSRRTLLTGAAALAIAAGAGAGSLGRASAGPMITVYKGPT
jgi:hypothetical protein